MLLMTEIKDQKIPNICILVYEVNLLVNSMHWCWSIFFISLF